MAKSEKSDSGDVSFRTTIEKVSTGKKGVEIKFGPVRELAGKGRLMEAADEQRDVIVSLILVQPEPELFDGEKS